MPPIQSDSLDAEPLRELAEYALTKRRCNIEENTAMMLVGEQAPYFRRRRQDVCQRRCVGTYRIIACRSIQYRAANPLRARPATMLSGLEILSWSFWSPETREPSEWRAASGSAVAPVPDHAIPPAHRRRMSTLSKMAVQTALDASRASRPDFLVFCSQHGELARTRELLGAIVEGGELSPTSFSQSVHNASAGLFSIITSSQTPSTSLAAGAGTFAYGWIEAEAFIAANPGKRSLLVCYDEPLPPEYRPYSRQEQRPHALALLLGFAPGRGITLEPSEPAADEPVPLAPLFIAWALSAEPTLRVTAGGQGWTWRRLGK